MVGQLQTLASRSQAPLPPALAAPLAGVQISPRVAATPSSPAAVVTRGPESIEVVFQRTGVERHLIGMIRVLHDLHQARG